LAAKDVGRYSVAISNAAGRILSSPAIVDVLPSVNITEGLVAYFKFDETGGTTAKNSAPSGKDGTLLGYDQGQPSFVAGKVGNSLAFDGTTTYVFVPDYTKATTGITVMGWVNPDEALGTYGPIINNWQKDRGAREIGLKGQFLLETAPDSDIDGNPIAHVNADLSVGVNEALTSATTAPFTGKWTHVAMTANGALLAFT